MPVRTQDEFIQVVLDWSDTLSIFAQAGSQQELLFYNKFVGKNLSTVLSRIESISDLGLSEASHTRTSFLSKPLVFTPG